MNTYCICVYSNVSDVALKRIRRGVDADSCLQSYTHIYPHKFSANNVTNGHLSVVVFIVAVVLHSFSMLHTHSQCQFHCTVFTFSISLAERSRSRCHLKRICIFEIRVQAKIRGFVVLMTLIVWINLHNYTCTKCEMK